MRNTAVVTGGKPIAVWSQFIAGEYAINPVVAFYFVPDTAMYKKKSREVSETKLKNIFYFVSNTTLDFFFLDSLIFTG
jgi:hypothetical protein